MYLRFTVSYFDEERQVECSGIFRAADYVMENVRISNNDRETLAELIKWFDNNMPIPDFYQNPNERGKRKKNFFGLKIVQLNLLEK